MLLDIRCNALQVEGNTFTDQLFDFGAGLSCHTEPRQCRHVGTPTRCGLLVDDCPISVFVFHATYVRLASAWPRLGGSPLLLAPPYVGYWRPRGVRSSPTSSPQAVQPYLGLLGADLVAWTRRTAFRIPVVALGLITRPMCESASAGWAMVSRVQPELRTSNELRKVSNETAAYVARAACRRRMSSGEVEDLARNPGGIVISTGIARPRKST